MRPRGSARVASRSLDAIGTVNYLTQASIMQLVTLNPTSLPAPAAVAAVAEEKSAQRRRLAVHVAADRRFAAGNGLRKREVPKSAGMLVAKDGHVHDFGERLHAAMRFLLGAQGQDGSVGD